MELLLGVSVAGLIFILIGTSWGWPSAAFAACLVAACVAPFAVSGQTSVGHSGITDGTPRLYVYSVAVIIGLVTSISSPHVRLVPKSTWALGAVLLIWGLFLWSGSPAEWAGVFHLLVASAAWILAVVFGCQAGDNTRLERLVAATVVVILVVELGIGLAQWAGITVPLYGQGAFAGSLFRATGTLGHPGNLGKALLLLLILALPLTKNLDASTRRIGLTSAALVTILTGMTLGRANIVAVLATVVIWLLLDRESGVGAKVRTALLALALSAPFLESFLSRFESDPTGGERPELTAEALVQISRTPFVGTGPNNYVDVVGQFGSATAAGFPVHNSFLLALAELGIVGAVLLFLPFLGATLRGVRGLGKKHAVDYYGRALLAATPGIAVTAYTGWGILSQSLLVMMILVYGYTYARSLSIELRPDVSPANERDATVKFVPGARARRGH